MCGDPYCPSCGAAQGTLPRPRLCLLPADDKIHTDPQCDGECLQVHHDFQDGGPEGLCSAEYLPSAKKWITELFEADNELATMLGMLEAVRQRLNSWEPDDMADQSAVNEAANQLSELIELMGQWEEP